MFDSPKDPSQNYIDRSPHPLDPLFHARSVAVIGAKDDPGSVGRTIMVNLLSSYKGKIFPVNPKRKQVLGLTAYPSVAEISEGIDLAIIVTPAATVPKLVQECTDAGVKSAIIISAGFKELGEAGIQLEEEIIRIARCGSMPIIGPNCLGVMNPIEGLNATFAKGMALPGHIAFISQSGAMCTAVLDWSFQVKVGFSAFVSIGSMADVNWGTLIDYLGSDPHTKSLLLYMETIGDARSFMTAAREVALEKPIIVIKAGKSQAAALAAASHTGSLAGSDEIFDAALERIGVLRVNSIAELFQMASVLAKQPPPQGPELTLVTNAGGPAVLATDAVVINHAELTPLPAKTIEALNQILPPAWSHSNPIDILGDADSARYASTVELLIKEGVGDGLLVILSPQDMTDPTATAASLKQLALQSSKPFLASWMGGESVKEGSEILSNADIPVFAYPDDAAKTFATMWRYSKNLKQLYEMPTFQQKSFVPYQGGVETQKIILQAQHEHRVLLSEFESKRVLASYGIPVVKTVIAHTVEEALAQAQEIGFPVVLKLFSQTITHKTDVGGVKLNLQNSEAVREAFHQIQKAVKAEEFDGVTVQKMVRYKGFELILGSSTDPQFGPVLLFGMGGQFVEILKDSALALPPLTVNLARHLMQKTKIYAALLGVRGQKPVDIKFLEEILILFSQMVVENPRIKECDINPLLASDEGIVALDARILLHPADISDQKLPAVAIRPYPYYYTWAMTLKNGQAVTLRPIRPEDAPEIVAFHKELSENSVRQRYFEFMSLDWRVAHERLVRICFNDYDREWTIVAEVSQEGNRKIIGVGRLMRIPGTNRAQFKMMIIDAFHHLGLGSNLLKRLLEIAKKEKIAFVDGHILAENLGMLKICERLGFILHANPSSPIVHAELEVVSNPL